MSKKFRCELCFRATFEKQLTRVDDDLLCPKCVKDCKSVEAPRAIPTNSKEARCERCNELKIRKYMTVRDDEHICEPCANKSGMCWFAVAVVGNDAKVQKAIKDKFRTEGQINRLGKVIIPRAREARRTKRRWRALDASGAPIMIRNEITGKMGFADISCDTTDQYEAYEEARRQFDGRVEAITETRRVRKTIDRKRQTIDQIHIVGQKVFKVADVQQVSEGQKIIVQNKKAMPGYLLVNCDNDHDLLQLIKQTKGVYSVLPFTERMDYEEYTKAEEEGEVPKPHVVSDREVEKFAADPKDKPIELNYKVGDRVKIVSGMYATSNKEFPVLAILGTKANPQIRVQTELLGRPVEVNVSYSDVRKA